MGCTVKAGLWTHAWHCTIKYWAFGSSGSASLERSVRSCDLAVVCRYIKTKSSNTHTPVSLSSPTNRNSALEGTHHGIRLGIGALSAGGIGRPLVSFTVTSRGASFLLVERRPLEPPLLLFDILSISLSQ